MESIKEIIFYFKCKLFISIKFDPFISCHLIKAQMQWKVFTWTSWETNLKCKILINQFYITCIYPDALKVLIINLELIINSVYIFADRTKFKTSIQCLRFNHQCDMIYKMKRKSDSSQIIIVAKGFREINILDIRIKITLQFFLSKRGMQIPVHTNIVWLEILRMHRNKVKVFSFFFF